MYAWFYKGSDLVAFPIAGLLIFVTVFVVVVLRAYSRAQRPAYDRAAAMPLEDDSTVIPHDNANPKGVDHGSH